MSSSSIASVRDTSVSEAAEPSSSGPGPTQADTAVISMSSELLLDVDTVELLRMSKALCGCTEQFNRSQWENMCPRIFPAPQFPIYHKSASDQKMRVPDFVVLYLTGSQDPLYDLDLLPFNEALDKYSREGWKIEDAAILTIIEVKSVKINVTEIGLERVEDIPELVHARYLSLITEATSQATSQAEMFFADPKNKDIDATVVVGIINDNWSWAKIERTQVAITPSKGSDKKDNIARSTSLPKKTSGSSQVPRYKLRPRLNGLTATITSKATKSILASRDRKGKGKEKMKYRKREKSEMAPAVSEGISWSTLMPWVSSEANNERRKLLETLHSLHPGRNF